MSNANVHAWVGRPRSAEQVLLRFARDRPLLEARPAALRLARRLARRLGAGRLARPWRAARRRRR
eukprot:5805576-Prymnesium_polylepis.1